MTLARSDNSFLLADAVPTPHMLKPSVPETLSSLAMDCIRLDPVRRVDVPEIIRRLDAIEFILADRESQQYNLKNCNNNEINQEYC